MTEYKLCRAYLRIIDKLRASSYTEWICYEDFKTSYYGTGEYIIPKDKEIAKYPKYNLEHDYSRVTKYSQYLNTLNNKNIKTCITFSEFCKTKNTPLNEITMCKKYMKLLNNVRSSCTKWLCYEDFKKTHYINGEFIQPEQSVIDKCRKYELTHDELYIVKYIQVSMSAHSRFIEFSIPYSEFREIYKRRICHYTGKKLSYKKDISIDRVDNNKGYVSGNCVVCDVEFNRRKSDLSITEIELLYKGIIRHRQINNNFLFMMMNSIKQKIFA